MSSEITLDKFYLQCAGTVKAEPTGNNSGFITYSNTINFYSKQLDNSGYIITQGKKLVIEQAVTWFKNQ